MATGRFVTIEGGDGAGKTTQIRLLKAWLIDSGWVRRIGQSMAVNADALLVTREPGGTRLGQSIRGLVLDSKPQEEEPLDEMAELFLYLADRAHHTTNLIKPHLERGGLVLCDRYVDSTMAYQGYGREMHLGVVHQLNRFATDSLFSDLTLCLDVCPQVGLSRRGLQEENAKAGLDRLESETKAFHERVRKGFRHLAIQNPDRIVLIDAELPVEAVADQVKAVVEAHLDRWYV